MTWTGMNGRLFVFLFLRFFVLLTGWKGRGGGCLGSNSFWWNKMTTIKMSASDFDCTTNTEWTKPKRQMRYQTLAEWEGYLNLEGLRFQLLGDLIPSLMIMKLWETKSSYININLLIAWTREQIWSGIPY